MNCNFTNDGVDDYTLAVVVGCSGVKLEQILDLQVRKQGKIVVRRVSMITPQSAKVIQAETSETACNRAWLTLLWSTTSSFMSSN